MLKKIQEKKADLEKQFIEMAKARNQKQAELENLNAELLKLQGAFRELTSLEKELTDKTESVVKNNIQEDAKPKK